MPITSWRCLITCAIGALIFLGLFAAPARAEGAGVDIGSQIVIFGASVNCPGQPVRELDATQAAAFMQSWLPASIFGKVTSENPPTGVDVCHLVVTDSWQGGPKTTLTALYATQGENVWVGMPPQSLGPGAYVQQERWIQAPFAQRTKDAFAGHGQLVPVALDTTAPPTTAASTANHANNGGSSSSGWVIVVAVVLVLALIATVAGLLFRRRRGASRGSAVQNSNGPRDLAR